MNNAKFHAGEWVQVRSKEEILKTLDKNGQLEGLPFMPQMFQYCGQRLKVYKRAHKTCDTVNHCKGRTMHEAVHLEGIRCDGQAYGGCEAACLIFWKEAWLLKVAEKSSAVAISPAQEPRKESAPASGCREEDVWTGTKRSAREDGADPSYVCQATQLPAASEPLAWWDVRQYTEDLASGNVGVARMLRGFIYMSFRNLINLGIGLGAPLRFLYDRFQRLWGGIPYPRRVGKIPAGSKTPNLTLNLQPGELVRVKSYDEILATLDVNNKNRGLYFDAEMVPYCGHSFRVLRRVKRILDESTGKMMEFKNPCIMLEGVFCQSRYSECRLFCPRSIYSYWREIWLERVSEVEGGKTTPAKKICGIQTLEPSINAACTAHRLGDQSSGLRDHGVEGEKVMCGNCGGGLCPRVAGAGGWRGGILPKGSLGSALG
jgi:hypothetical protein